MERIEIGQPEPEPLAGDERRERVVAPKQPVGEVEGVGVGRAVVEIGRHANTGLAGAQLVAGDDGDARVPLEVAARSP